MVATTAAPATPWLAVGAGDAAAQQGEPRLADYVNGGWHEGVPPEPPVTTSAHTSQTPISNDVDNGAPLTTGVKYVFDAAGTVSAIRFWVPAINVGTYTVGWYAVTHDDDTTPFGQGTLLASATVAAGAIMADQWAQVPITPQAVLSGHTYLAAVHSSSGHYVASAGAFGAAGISNGGVTAIQTGTDPNLNPGGTMRNGTFIEGPALAYPATVFGSADYFTDVAYAVTA